MGGVPVYQNEYLSADFISGIDRVAISYYNTYPQFSVADFAVKLRGASFEPDIRHGDLVFFKVINNLDDIERHKDYVVLDGPEVRKTIGASILQGEVMSDRMLLIIGVMREY